MDNKYHCPRDMVMAGVFFFTTVLINQARKEGTDQGSTSVGEAMTKTKLQ